MKNADMNHDETRLLQAHADAAALMLAAVDDREGLNATLKGLTYGETVPLLLGAIEAGATLINYGEQFPDKTPRELLGVLIAACREDVR